MLTLKLVFWMRTKGKAKSVDIARWLFQVARWDFYELLHMLRLVSNTKRDKEQNEVMKALFEKIFPYVLPDDAFEYAVELVESTVGSKAAQRMREARETRGL